MRTDPVEADPPDEVFGLVANEVRFSILQALWTARTHRETPMTFSSLLDEVDVDDSGRFNYHLNKLVPRFVLGGGEGYDLTHAGRRLIGAVYSGTYTESEVAAIESTPVGTCPNCGGEMAASYGAGELLIECVECDLQVTNLGAPPSLVRHHGAEELPTALTRHFRTTVFALNRGFCRLCSGPVERSFARFSDPVKDLIEDRMAVVYRCSVCGDEVHGGIGTAVADQPPVVGFLADVGVDLETTPLWEQSWFFETDGEVVGEDPIRVESAVEVDDARLELVLDGDVRIEHATRS